MQENQKISSFPPVDHEAIMNRQENMTNKHKAVIIKKHPKMKHSHVIVNMKITGGLKHVLRF